MQQIKVTGHSIEWKQTDGRTEARMEPIALPSVIMRSVTTANYTVDRKNVAVHLTL